MRRYATVNMLLAVLTLALIVLNCIGFRGLSI
jgi:hypothetical protein